MAAAEVVVKSSGDGARGMSLDTSKVSQSVAASATGDDAVAGLGERATKTAVKTMDGRRLLRGDAVRAKTALGRSSMYAMVRAGTFPRPVQLGARSVAWVEDEVEAWVTARIRKRDDAEHQRTRRAG